MPRIPTITAQGQAGVLQLPRPTPRTFGAEGFHELAKAGERLGAIHDSLQGEQDKLDLANLAGEYEGGLADIRLRLKQDPDFHSHAEKFTKEATRLQGDLAKRTTRRPVQQALQSHFARTLPRETVEVQADSLTLWTQHQLAELDQVEESLSKSAAEADTPAKRDEKITLYQSILQSQERARVMTPVDRQKRSRSFEQKMLEKHMDVLRRTDRQQLRELDRSGAFAELDPIKRLKILEAARADEEREEVRTDRAFKDAQDVVERDWAALANQGLLPDAELEAALKGEDQFIAPDKARQYQTINASPVTGEGSLQIRSVMQDYHSGPSTLPRIEGTRKALNRLAREMGRPNPMLDKAFNELQTDERTMRSVQAAEVSAGIKIAEDEYKAKSEPLLPGRIGTLQKNQQASELAELRNQIRRGKDPVKAAEEMLKSKQPRIESLPDTTKDVIDLGK